MTQQMMQQFKLTLGIALAGAVTAVGIQYAVSGASLIVRGIKIGVSK